MSKFIDKLNQVSRDEPQSIGFRTIRSVSPKPKMLLVASLAQTNIDNVAEFVAGVDAWVLTISKTGSGTRNLQKISQAQPEIPWGGWLEGSSQGEIEQIVKAGGDFAVFPAVNTSLATFQDGELGKILEVESSLSDGLLRTVNDLPVDAVFVAGGQGEDYILTWRHLMLFQHFADLLTKPLLVSVPSTVADGELKVLYEAGVAGVVVEVGVGLPQGKLKELRQVVDKLDTPSPRKRGKAEAIIPHISRESSPIAEEVVEEE